MTKDYATECLLNYECIIIKNHCKIITVDLSRQNELCAFPKLIKQIQFAGELSNIDGVKSQQNYLKGV